MDEKTLSKIEKDIRENIGWLENEEPRQLHKGAISTIMAIIRKNMENKGAVK